MTDYQAIPCPQCKGDMTITLERRERTKHNIIKVMVGYPAWKVVKELVVCGYCKGKGAVAVDVDKLEKA